jgi:hypothetical protein
MNKIKRIFLFGDSWIEGQGTFETMTINNVGPNNTHIEVTEPNLSQDELRIWRRKNSWEKAFKKLIPNVEIINYGIQGCNNYLQLNYLNQTYTTDFNKSDLILFGFTSKYRDYPYQIRNAYQQLSLDNGKQILLHEQNPLNYIFSFAKSELPFEKFRNGLNSYKNDFERKFTEKYKEDFFTQVFDEVVFEKLAQANYLFYQNWFKESGFGNNILFFDIFEKYIDESYVNDLFDMDSNMYVTYKGKTLFEELKDYELNSWPKDLEYSIWERPADRHPQFPLHPNQYGYEYLVNWFWDNYLSKRYKFI